jgi:hypothetical protein
MFRRPCRVRIARSQARPTFARAVSRSAGQVLPQREGARGARVRRMRCAERLVERFIRDGLQKVIQAHAGSRSKP